MCGKQKPASHHAVLLHGGGRFVVKASKRHVKPVPSRQANLLCHVPAVDDHGLTRDALRFFRGEEDRVIGNFVDVE